MCTVFNFFTDLSPRIAEEHHYIIYQKLVLYAAKWRDIGMALGFQSYELDTIQAKPMLLARAPKSWLSEMLSQWLQWSPGDRRESKDYASVKSLKEALLEVNLGRLAEEFNHEDLGKYI